MYIDKRSPPVRACLMLAKMLNIDLDYKEIDLFKGEQSTEEFLKVRSAGRQVTLLTLIALFHVS